jgi:NAD(P)-dependent dehydrogenase (short-subunit alcohol dehydrogenase family)
LDTGLNQKVAVVTGASEGLGAAISSGLRAEGCRLAILARGKEKLDRLAAELARGAPNEVITIVCDVMSAEQVNAGFAKILAHFGGIDILVNNAGGPSSTAFDFESIDDGSWLKTFEFNVLSSVRATRLALPSMLAKGWGRVINISSESAQQPDAGSADYNASKAALNTLTKTLSKNYADRGVLFNVVAPAFTETPLMKRFVGMEAERLGIDYQQALAGMLKTFRPHIEVKRAGKASEVAAAVVFLASEQASFINGSIVRVDGGSVASI